MLSNGAVHLVEPSVSDMVIAFDLAKEKFWNAPMSMNEEIYIYMQSLGNLDGRRLESWKMEYGEQQSWARIVDSLEFINMCFILD